MLLSFSLLSFTLPVQGEMSSLTEKNYLVIGEGQTCEIPSHPLGVYEEKQEDPIKWKDNE